MRSMRPPRTATGGRSMRPRPASTARGTRRPRPTATARRSTRPGPASSMRRAQRLATRRPSAIDRPRRVRRTPHGRDARVGLDRRITPAPPVAVERRATDPLLALKRHLDRWTGATIVLADSAGRRETMLQFFAEYDLRPDVVDGYRDFVESGSAFALCVGPLQEGFVAHEPPIVHLTETELYRDQARARRRGGKRAAGAREQRRDDGARPVGAARRRPGRSRAARHRPLPRPRDAWTSAKARWSSCTSNTPTTPSCTCRCRSCT